MLINYSNDVITMKETNIVYDVTHVFVSYAGTQQIY